MGNKEKWLKWMLACIILYVIAGLLGSGIIAYLSGQIRLVYFQLLVISVLAYTFMLIGKLKFNIPRFTFRLVLALFFLTYIYTISWQAPIFMLFSLPLVMITYTFNSFREVLILCGLILAASITYPLLPDFIINLTYRASADRTNIREIITIAYSFVACIMILYFNYRLKEGNAKYGLSALPAEKDNSIESDIAEQADENCDLAIDNEKLEDIYSKILVYFEEEKPYTNADFSLTDLSYVLDSNVTYVSQAINLRKGENFNYLVNEYRVNQVKEQLSNNFHKNYTLRHIYINAGFSHQSTFNRAFKQITGMTPSQYVKLLEVRTGEKV